MTKIHDSEENQNLIRKWIPLIFCQSLWFFQIRIEIKSFNDLNLS